MISELWKKTLYLKDIDFLINDTIYEYDLAKANISILRHYNMISQKIYEKLFNAERVQRQVIVGKLQKSDPAIAEALSVGFVEARRLFFEMNGLEDKDILSIKKDAIFCLRQVPYTLVAEYMNFVAKNLYTSYYYIPSQKKEIYYCNCPNIPEKLDIKGMSDESLKLHEGYMKEFIMVLFDIAQSNIKEALDTISRFIDLYRQRSLDIEFYRTFDTNSKFIFKSSPNTTEVFSSSLPFVQNKDYLDISYNNNLLIDLYKIISKQYTIMTRKPRC